MLSNMKHVPFISPILSLDLLLLFFLRKSFFKFFIDLQHITNSIPIIFLLSEMLYWKTLNTKKGLCNTLQHYDCACAIFSKHSAPSTVKNNEILGKMRAWKNIDVNFTTMIFNQCFSFNWALDSKWWD